MAPDLVSLLTGGCGRGYTVLCTVADPDLLRALATVAGATGVVIAAGDEPPQATDWAAVRCDPARSIPVRSHVVDAVVLAQTGDLTQVAEEVRRTLVPGGDVRVLASDRGETAAALRGASIHPLRWEPPGVWLGRGP